MIPRTLTRSIPDDLQIMLADVGSAGGLHKRWAPIRDHVTALLFDPLDQSTGSDRDRYFPVALAREAGRATIHVTKRVSMTSTLLANRPLIQRFWDKPDHMAVVSTLEVPVDALDSVLKPDRIAPDVIKIDVQGGEYGILEGSRSALASSLFLAEVEVSFFERYSGLRPVGDVVALMRENGFNLIDISRIKRYRYRNSFGIVNPGLGMGDRAGRIAFCDALFVLDDDLLMERLASASKTNGSYLAEKLILTLLTYGKADMAAWIFDTTQNQLDLRFRSALSGYLKSLGGRHFGRKGLHKALDYIAKNV